MSQQAYILTGSKEPNPYADAFDVPSQNSSGSSDVLVVVLIIVIAMLCLVMLLCYMKNQNDRVTAMKDAHDMAMK